MTELYHYYSLTPEWLQESSKRINATLIRDTIMIMPRDIGVGTTYFTQVIPGISVVLLDTIFTKKTIIRREKSNHDLYILQFDISDETNLISLDNDSLKKSTNFSVLHSSIGNSFTPTIKKRVFAMRILIDKKTLMSYTNSNDKNFKNIEKKILFYNHDNSSNTIHMHSLKEKSIFDIGFDSYIKGISLKILANFIENFSNQTKEKTTKIERDTIILSKNYLLNNIYGNFPTLTHLSRTSGMSTTKYKILFKKINNTTPYQFFLKHKLELAHQLIISGKFSSITEITEMLNYPKPENLKIKYFKYFKRKPLDDFIKKQP